MAATNLISNPSFKLTPKNLSSPFVISKISKVSSKTCKNTHFLKLDNLASRASTEGVPFELIEDSKFVPMDTQDLNFGPPALLLLGFDLNDSLLIKQLLKDLDGDFLEVIYCTEEMMNQTLWDAMNTTQPNSEQVKIAKSLPRICIFSGLTGEETMMFIDAFQESGLEPAVFAALVPNSADKPVAELVEEIMADHELLSGKQPGSM